MMAPETVVTVESNKGSPQQGGQQGQLDWLKINVSYFKTHPGILKLVELVLGIICMACASPFGYSATHWFEFVAVTSFISTLVWTFIYLLSIRDALNLPINWILTELLNLVITTVLYFTAFIVQLATWSSIYGPVRGGNITAGVFGLFNTIAYAASTYFVYLEHKSNVASVSS